MCEVVLCDGATFLFEKYLEIVNDIYVGSGGFELNWSGLVDSNSITVTLTPIGSHQDLYVSRVENNKVYISSENEETTSLIEKDYFYVIYAERKDVEKLQVEIG